MHIGPRTCIGHKFATTEAVCFLTFLLRDYRVEPILMGGETNGEWQERVLQAKLQMSLAIREVPALYGLLGGGRLLA
jgi:cytochrome P450